MAFMQPEIILDEWYEIDGRNGIEYIPGWLVTGEIDIEGLHHDIVVEQSDPPGSWVSITYPNGEFDVPSELRDYTENHQCYSISRIKGYGARLSAPGYLDCTEWTVFATEKEAKAYLAEMTEDDGQEDCEE